MLANIFTVLCASYIFACIVMYMFAVNVAAPGKQRVVFMFLACLLPVVAFTALVRSPFVKPNKLEIAALQKSMRDLRELLRKDMPKAEKGATVFYRVYGRRFILAFERTAQEFGLQKHLKSA